MEMTLTGVFGDFAQAGQACERLKSEGIDDRMTRLTFADVPLQMPCIVAGHPEFFTGLSGLDESGEAADHDIQAKRWGSALLSVHLQDEGRVQQIRRLLEQCGATEIDRHAEQWTLDGPVPYSVGGSTAERSAQ